MITRSKPITCRGCNPHPPFELSAGDRACRTYPEAVALAASRAPKRGRQMVRRHVGSIFRSGVWFVQDVRITPEYSAATGVRA